jgi:hypothetical protein
MKFLKPRKPDSGTPARPLLPDESEPETSRAPQGHSTAAEEDAKRAGRKAARHKILAEEEQNEDDEEEDGEEEEEEDAQWDFWAFRNDKDDDLEDGSSEHEGYEDEEGEDEDTTPSGSRIEPCADRSASYFARLSERRSAAKCRGLVGVSTGLPQLDQATGGLQQITLIAGRKQTGKTSLATQMCLAALRSDQKLAVVYYLLDDMTEDDLFDQMLCFEAGVDHAKFVSGQLSAAEHAEVKSASSRLQKEIWARMHIIAHIEDRYGQGVTGENIYDRCRYFMSLVGAERAMPVLDMFNDLPHPRDSHRWEEDHRAILRRIESDPDRWRLEQILKLRDLSQKDCPGGWPILALCQLRKPSSYREEPEVEDMLGGVDLGYKAKRVFILIPDATANPSKPVMPVTLVVKKARHATSERLPLLFRHTQFRFAEMKDSTQQGSKAGKKGSRPASESRPKSSSSFDPLAGMEP